MQDALAKFVGSFIKNINRRLCCQHFAFLSQPPISDIGAGEKQYRKPRASSYEPGNWAGPEGGTNFVFCLYGKFNPGYRDEKCPKGPQNTRAT